MSHFTCVVFGDDVGLALEPFNEQKIDYETIPVAELLHEYLLKDGQEVNDDTAMKFIKNYVTKEREPVAIVEEAWLEDESVIKSYRGEIAESGYFTYMTFNAEGELNMVYRRTFGNCKWDWFQIGGRWNGWLLAKNPKTLVKLSKVDSQYVGRGAFDSKPIHENGCDRLRKKDIDLQGMIDKHLATKLEYFDKYHPMRKQFHVSMESRIEIAIRKLREAGHEVDDTVPMWRSKNEIIRNAYVEAVNKYWEQPSCTGLRDDFYSYDTCDKFFKHTRESYIEEETVRAFLPFSFIHNGKWHERGKMGWFGMAHDEEDCLSWGKRFKEVWDSVPDDTYVTVVDCHT